LASEASSTVKELFVAPGIGTPWNFHWLVIGCCPIAVTPNVARLMHVNAL